MSIGPWAADLLLNPLVNATGDVTASSSTASGTAAGGLGTIGPFNADLLLSIPMNATGDVASGMSAGGGTTTEGVTPEVLGPWDADLQLPVPIDATGDVVFVTPEWEPLGISTDGTFSDYTAKAGVTYQYRVTDADGSVITSDEVTALGTYQGVESNTVTMSSSTTPIHLLRTRIINPSMLGGM